MKLTPTACCTIRASPGPGAAVSSSVHTIASAPPAARTTMPMSPMIDLDRAFLAIHEPPDAFARAPQLTFFRGKTNPDEVPRPLPERTAVDHRNTLGAVQICHELMARE